MDPRNAKFFRILLIELEDLMQDFREAVARYAARNLEGEVTNYVMRENAALLENEIAGVDHVCRVLREMEAGEDESFDDLVERVRADCRRSIAESHFPDALFGMIDRKISKVENYIRE